MGYRSTVAYTIRFVYHKHPDRDDIEDRKKCEESFYTFIADAKANEDTAYCFSEYEGGVFKVDEDNLAINFFAEDVKWYEDYSDVKCHEALISLSKSWADDNEYIGGVFARVGEDLDDMVEESWGQSDYSWINIARSVCVDWE